jgi:hypothetical protein
MLSWKKRDRTMRKMRSQVPPYLAYENECQFTFTCTAGTYLCVQSKGQLGDATGDFIKVYRFGTTVPFDHMHRHGRCKNRSNVMMNGERKNDAGGGGMPDRDSHENQKSNDGQDKASNQATTVSDAMLFILRAGKDFAPSPNYVAIAWFRTI